MHEQAPRTSGEQIVDPSLAESRLLTDVDNLLAHMHLHGYVSESVQQDDIQNKATALCETAIPAAVTTTEHRVEYRRDEAGRRSRVITWLGKTAIELAEAGRAYHFSPEAHARVDIEVREAADSQATLKPGIAKVFISPKMSAKDASVATAKAEHLHDDDSLRVSYAVTNSSQEVVGRKMQSLLVRDIPLSAWVAMLKDDSSVFGQAFSVRDEESALSVMGLFSQLDLPEERLPEGPVSLVEAVLPYIKDAAARDSVQHQLEAFRGDQTFYAEQSRRKAEEWSAFDLELARSLRTGKATDKVYSRIASFQFEWSSDALHILKQHELENARYRMSRELAAVLEQSIRRELEGKVAARTGNERALRGVSAEARAEIVRRDVELDNLRMSGASAEQIHLAQVKLGRMVVTQNIRTGGGCSGSTKNMFGSKEGEPRDPGVEYENGVGEGGSPYKATGPEDKSSWKWKKGICVVKSCATRPGQTDVGPCSICRHCQAEFDAGRDPTKNIISRTIAKVSKAAGEFSVRAIFYGERAAKKAKNMGEKAIAVVTERKNK